MFLFGGQLSAKRTADQLGLSSRFKLSQIIDNRKVLIAMMLRNYGYAELSNFRFRGWDYTLHGQE